MGQHLKSITRLAKREVKDSVQHLGVRGMSSSSVIPKRATNGLGLSSKLRMRDKAWKISIFPGWYKPKMWINEASPLTFVAQGIDIRVDLR